MAVTKIWKICVRLDSSINYIINPQKTTYKPDLDTPDGEEIRTVPNQNSTEECMFVTGYNCDKDEAYKQMLETQERFGKSGRKNGSIAYHVLQSFKDYEITPELAHSCGCELAERLFADKYEVVVATHLDHKHLHNHIILNSVSFLDGEKYHRSLKNYFLGIRGISDDICRENSLSVIENPKGKGLHYAEWKALKEGKPTIRGQVREELDEIIKVSYTYKDFWKTLLKRGYEVNRRGDNIKYTSIIPPFGKRPIRLDNLGPQYSEEAILERIKAQRNGIKMASPTELSKRRKYKVKNGFKGAKSKKLKGFQALYFRYLYLFGKIRKKQTPQRVSFFLREEMIKLERYQRQFKFLVKNDVETGEDLQRVQNNLEAQVEELIQKRIKLYEGRNDENGEEIKEKAKAINTELTQLRIEVRLCKAIFKDAYRIAENKRKADLLQKQADRELSEGRQIKKNRKL